MNRKHIYILMLWGVMACNEQPKSSKPIVMGDTSTIVTERDSAYLQNNTEDISPTNKRSSEGKITQMMTEVDSAKSVKKLESEENKAPLSGFVINFSECTVQFDGLSAHAIQNSQNERTSNSVSYLKDGGNLFEMTLQVQGLDQVKLEQRTFTKLKVQNDEQEFLLQDLGKFISPWSNLASKDNRFVSLGSNSLQFFPVDNNKIKNALDRELRKKKKNRQEIQEWLNLIRKTNSYSDSPCKLIMVSVQWRIIGMKDGKRVQKLIQFDIPA